jgi:SEC-C motif
MGAMAEAFVAFAQPLIDKTDGSTEQLNKALALSQFCYNLAILPEDARSEALTAMQRTLEMDDEEFEDFQSSVVLPMIARHHLMFPFLHQRVSSGPSQSSPSLEARRRKSASAERYPGTDRYAPCPCGSGEKYKFCCGKKGR